MIECLNLKLSGQEPVTREELLELVNSWGRKDDFYTNSFSIKKSKSKECYPLENLDVSQISDLSDVFKYSNFNGNLSNWNISNTLNLSEIFAFSDFNNNSIKDWNVSNVINMYSLFYQSKFNGDLSNWDVSSVIDLKFSFSSCSFDGDISKWKFNEDIKCSDIFYKNKNFAKKYNHNKILPMKTEDFLQWFEENKINISNLNTTKEKVLDFFNFDNNNEIKR